MKSAFGVCTVWALALPASAVSLLRRPVHGTLHDVAASWTLQHSPNHVVVLTVWYEVDAIELCAALRSPQQSRFGLINYNNAHRVLVVQLMEKCVDDTAFGHTWHSCCIFFPKSLYLHCNEQHQAQWIGKQPSCKALCMFAMLAGQIVQIIVGHCSCDNTTYMPCPYYCQQGECRECSRKLANAKIQNVTQRYRTDEDAHLPVVSSILIHLCMHGMKDSDIVPLRRSLHLQSIDQYLSWTQAFMLACSSRIARPIACCIQHMQGMEFAGKR